MAILSILKIAVRDFVRQHPKGIEFNLVVRQFAAVDKLRLQQALYNLRQDGIVHRVSQGKGNHGNALWRPGLDPDKPAPVTWKLIKHNQRAREADAREPLVYYGEGLQPPRCPSVWAYARHFQERRA